MSLLPSLRVKYGEVVGVEVFVEFPEIDDNEKTYFDADEAASQTVLSSNGTNFSSGQYVVLGRQGVEKTEIARVSGAPTSTAITVAAATTFAHSRGDLIRFIPYNQIVVERSTDAGVNFSALSAVDIRADALETYLQRSTDASTDVYRFRFYNSADVTYSAYSDSVTATGYADNTVYSIKFRALEAMGEKKGGLITDSFLNNSLNEARRIVDKDPRILRWSFRTKFDSDIGDCIPGRWSVASPSDLRNPDQNENILAIRIGRQNYNLTYQDINTFNQNYTNVAHSTLSSQITTASTSIVLTSSGDFAESGSVDIAAESISALIDPAAYTSNTESTKTLGTVTGIGVTHASGRDVWQGATYGTPTAYTVHDGNVYFDVPFSDSLAGENIKMDYYQTLQAVDSDADTLDETEYDFYVSYLKYKIKYLKKNGEIDRNADVDYQDFVQGVNSLVVKETSGQLVHFIPDFDGLLSTTG